VRRDSVRGVSDKDCLTAANFMQQEHYSSRDGAKPPGPNLQWLTAGRFAAILGVLVFAAFPDVLLGSRTFVFRDFGLFGYPLAEYHRASFWDGEVPLWNPYNNFGIPFLAQWGTMALYPPSLVYLVLPLPWSLGLFCLLHLWLGGLGMYVLARYWTGELLAAALAGIAFAFSGFVVNCLMWPNYSATLAWMPWVVWATCKAWRGQPRYVGYASLIGATQMLSGTPEVILFTWLLVGGLWCCDSFRPRSQAFKSSLRITLVVGLVALLSAAQLLPFLDLLRHSERNSSFASNGGIIPIWGAANLLVPLFRTYGTASGVPFQEAQSLTSSYYPGLLVIVLSVTAALWVRDRRVWFLSAALLLSFVLAMGEAGILYRLIRLCLPWVGFMRYPAKLLAVGAFIWPLLAAFGVAALLRHERLWRRTGVITGLLVAGIAAIIVAAKVFPFPNEQWLTTARSGVERAVFLVVGAAAVMWFLKSRRAFALSLVGLLVWLDLVTHLPAHNPTATPDVFTMKLPHLEEMRPRPRLGESRALVSLAAMQTFHRPGTSNVTQTYLVHRSGLYDNCNLIDRLPKADGFYALYLARERDIHFRLFETDHQPRPALARFLGISQVSGRSNVLAWEPKTGFMRFVTAGQRPCFADDQQTLAALMTPSFSPEATVYLPETARGRVRTTNSGVARVISVDVRPHRIEAEVEADASSLVVVAQSYYPRWLAFVDGEGVALWRANHAFQALEVGPGKHRIELVYRDTPFLLGICISSFSLLGTLGFSFFISRKCTGRALDRDTANDVGRGIPGSRPRLRRKQA
jgi:hypothetical protein